MIHAFLAIPGEEDRDDRPKSSYVSPKDIKWVVLALLMVAALFIPVYDYLMGIRNQSVCSTQMQKMFQSVRLYAADNDDRFPPVVQVGPGSPGAPYVREGSVYSWISLIYRYDPKLSFQCPAADDSESASSQITDAKGGKQIIKSTYGMYAAYSGAPISGIERSNQTFFIGETSNFGSESSYDPKKFIGPDNKEIPIDGFSIGWNDDNIEPGPTTRAVTRLAFRNSANGDFREAYGRHGRGIHMLTVDGNLRVISPSEAQVQTIAGQIKGSWATPPMMP